MERFDEQIEREKREHLERVRENMDRRRRSYPCAHDQCRQCHGTGIKLDGTACIHMLYCSCPRCNPASF